MGKVPADGLARQVDIAVGKSPFHPVDRVAFEEFLGRRLNDKAGLDTAIGGADKNLDCFHGIRPRLLRYSIGLLPPRDILMRVSLYQRM